MIAPMGTYTTNNTGNAWTGNNPVTTSTGGVVFPLQYTNQGQEFGKAFDVPLNVLDDDPVVILTYDMVIRDYLRAKKEHFPNWNELPEIKVSSLGLSGRSIGWYIVVPQDQVIDPSVKEEEELWNQ